MKTLMRNHFENFHGSRAARLSRARVGQRGQRSCNLCSGRFSPKSAFERYCSTCREKNELLKFSECLPDLELAFQEKLIA